MSKDDSWPPVLPLDIYPPPPGSKQSDGRRTGLKKVVSEGTFGAVLGGLAALFYPNMDLTRLDETVAEVMPGSRGVAGSFLKLGGAIKRGGKNALFFGGFLALTAAFEETGIHFFPQYVRHSPVNGNVFPHPVLTGVASSLSISVVSLVFRQNPVFRAVLFGISMTSVSYVAEWATERAFGHRSGPPPTNVWNDERRDQQQQKQQEEEGEDEEEEEEEE